ncbi:DNA-binding transcriptional regulator ume6 [Sporothrix epigloea]|uniref:DNA-binding transcriptional regulator ume6 n=1 Tax=Sporothrix epigloea TaxID=1892477 RepID=A0ABP0DG24_9PEZI
MASPSPDPMLSSVETTVNIQKGPNKSKIFLAKSTMTAVSMAVSHTAKPKAVSSTPAKAKVAAATASSDATRQRSTQMHRRSRTGCYTCRLRRKKCDEGAPICSACKHLGLTCEYDRPHWWSNNDARRSQKDDIKVIIKRKKLSEKVAASMQASIVDSPSGPSRSSQSSTKLSNTVLPISVTFSDSFDRARSDSVDSHYPTATFDFNSPPTSSSEYGNLLTNGDSSSAFSTPQMHPDYMFGSGIAPFEVDITTERQVFVNNVPTMHESTASSISTYHTLQLPGNMLPPYLMYEDGTMVIDPTAGAPVAAGLDMTGTCVDPQLTQPIRVNRTGDQWTEQVHSERLESTTDEVPTMHFKDATQEAACQMATELEDGDKYLLEHFVQYVLPTLFPILEINQDGFAGSDVILPALQSNECYLHCCLGVSAQHLKALLGSAQIEAQAQGQPGQLVATADLDADIMRHRYSIISALCDALPRDENQQQVLESALALISFQCSVCRYDDALPDVPWYQHFQAAATLAQKLNLPSHVRTATISPEVTSPATTGDAHALENVGSLTNFNMTLMSWVDILGATMLGCPPVFAHTYREKLMSQPHLSSLGLQKLMGCEDRIMYLISEIACLEALKASGMDDITLCRHVSVLGDQIGRTELGEEPAALPFNANGTLNSKQLRVNITAAFRLAARIYLCSLIPGFCPSQASCRGLVDKLTTVLQTIPCGPAGFDRCVVWAYLMAGFASLPCSNFRVFFADRIAQMGDNAGVGSFGRVVPLLHEMWLQQNDTMQQLSEEQNREHEHLQTQHPQQRESSIGRSESPADEDEIEQMLPTQFVHWREVMLMKGWNFLLM